MRKQTKLVAVLSAAALLAIGASMTSFAAKGWAEENGSWYYYDNNGDYVTNDWQKSGNNWFWLGDDGAMMTSALIEDGNSKYYVDANGAMVTNRWVAIEPGDDDYNEDAPNHYWYFFGANGKAYKQSADKLAIKTINGKKYGFDQEGKMVYGFVQEDGTKNTDSDPFLRADYYFGSSDDGAMHTDWLQYTDGSDLTSTVNGTVRSYADQDSMWFYFKPSNGKMVKFDASKDTQKVGYKVETVRGQKYGFDENGVMIYEWQDASVSTVNKYFSSEDDGHLRKKTWVYAVPSENIDPQDFNDDQERWFYADATGKVYKEVLKTVNGKKYLFDDKGRMKSGLQLVKDGKYEDNAAIKDGDDVTVDKIKKYAGEAKVYFFSADEEKDGSMKTGKNIKVEMADGDTYTFGFDKAGKGYTGLVDKTKIYLNGLLLSASSDYGYQLLYADSTNAAGAPEAILDESNTKLDAVIGSENNKYDNYVISKSGSIVKEGRYVKDADDNYYAVSNAKAGSDGATKGTIKFFSYNVDDAQKKASDYARCGKIREGEGATDGNGNYKSLSSDCK